MNYKFVLNINKIIVLILIFRIKLKYLVWDGDVYFSFSIGEVKVDVIRIFGEFEVFLIYRMSFRL